MKIAKGKSARLLIRKLISVPFRILRRFFLWGLADSIRTSGLRARYPNVLFQGIEKISIGERVFIGVDCFFIAKAAITIGNDTMIAPQVTITTSTHDPAQNPMWKTAVFRPVLIGENAWIGVGAIILPGVKIGNHAIIGAGAVVSRHVPDRAVVVGNPARISHYREITPLDAATQSRYPYWEDVMDDYLPSDRVTKSLDAS